MESILLIFTQATGAMIWRFLSVRTYNFITAFDFSLQMLLFLYDSNIFATASFTTYKKPVGKQLDYAFHGEECSKYNV